MDSRRLPLLSSVAVILLFTGATRSEAGWLSGRDGRFRPFHHHSCTPLCPPPSCVVANPCECLPLLLPTPCAPASLAVVPEVVPASPLRLSGGAWYMSPTGHATTFLDTGRGFRFQLPPFSTSPPLYVLPPGGFGPPGETPPGGGSPPPPFGGPPSGPPSGPPGGPPGEPPGEPPGAEVTPVPSPPAVVLLVLGAVGLAAFRRRFFPLRV
jgi:hypothetical protein